MDAPAKSYVFRVVVEPDDDRWHAYCPALEDQGAVTWGRSEREALDNIRQVVEMVVDDILEEGDALPGDPGTDFQAFPETRVAVNV